MLGPLGIDPVSAAFWAIFALFSSWGFGFLDDWIGSSGTNAASDDPPDPSDDQADPEGSESETIDFADFIFGSNGDDSIEADTPNALIEALDGDDSVEASAGDDSILAGLGNDNVSGRLGDDSIFGGAGDDTVEAGQGDDVIEGGEGNDSISGAAGNDTISGDAGDDTMFGSAGADVLFGGEGNDLLNGYLGTESVSPNPAKADEVDTLQGGEGNDTLIGGSSDILSGGEGNDTFIAHEDVDAEKPVSVTDFVQGEDVLSISYDQSLDDSGVPIDPVLDISTSEDGANSIVSLDGLTRAVVEGQTELSAEDIILVSAS